MLTQLDNQETFHFIISRIMEEGQVVSPRGSKIREIEDFMFHINPMYPCMSFTARNFNVDYVKAEWIWKLSGDRFDKSIIEKAKAWATLADIDGGYNSNYGQFFFGKQNGFQWVVQELIRDKESRRAIIPMANESHLRTNNPDHVCTESISFRIRDNKLNMSVNMRSNDAIWGLTNDAVTFSCLYRMVYAYLQSFYEGLEIGRYVHKADSLHIYSRHWDMANKIISNGPYDFTPIEIPLIYTIEEVELLRATQGRLTATQLNMVSFPTPFYDWLVSE